VGGLKFSVILRQFDPSDLESIVQLFGAVVHSVGAKYYNAEQVNAWAPKDNVDKDGWLRSLSEHMTYVVEVDGNIVGFGDMNHSGYIDRLFVHKNYQGKGVALALFRKLEEEAKKLGLSELTTEASIVAKPVAERLGFEVIEEQRKIYRGVEFINYRMRKQL
jgi:putative acetyltransferase